MGKKIFVFAISIITSFAAGAIGSLATTSNIQPWYIYLEKPLFTPPNWLFAPAWSLLYLLMGITLALIILQRTKQSKTKAYTWFAIQLTLNTAWSLIFFGAHAMWAGGIIILMLIASIVATMKYFAKINRIAAWLLIPYIAWVCFATYLNLSIAFLN